MLKKRLPGFLHASLGLKDTIAVAHKTSQVLPNHEATEEHHQVQGLQRFGLLLPFYQKSVLTNSPVPVKLI